MNEHDLLALLAALAPGEVPHWFEAETPGKPECPEIPKPPGEVDLSAWYGALSLFRAEGGEIGEHYQRMSDPRRSLPLLYAARLDVYGTAYDAYVHDHARWERLNEEWRFLRWRAWFAQSMRGCAAAAASNADLSRWPK